MSIRHIGHSELDGDRAWRTRLANRLLERMEHVGLTVRELFRKSKVSEATIRKMLDPDDPTTPQEDTYSRLATALDCRPGWLRTGAGMPDREISQPPHGGNVCWIRMPKNTLLADSGLPVDKRQIDYRGPLERAIAAYQADDVWAGILANVASTLHGEIRERDRELSEYVDWVRLPDDEPASEGETRFLENLLCVLAGYLPSGSFLTRNHMENVINWCYYGACHLGRHDELNPPDECIAEPGKVVDLAAARLERLCRE